MPNTWGSKHTIYSVTSWDQYCYTAVIPATKSHELTWSKLPIFCLLVDFVWWHFLVKCKWNTTYITTIMKHMICVPYKIHESYISQSRYASTGLRHHGAFMFRHHQIGVRPSLNMVLIGQGLWWHMNPSLHHTHSVAVNTPCSTEVERSVKVLCSFLYDIQFSYKSTRDTYGHTITVNNILITNGEICQQFLRVTYSLIGELSLPSSSGRDWLINEIYTSNHPLSGHISISSNFTLRIVCELISL